MYTGKNPNLMHQLGHMQA